MVGYVGCRSSAASRSRSADACWTSWTRLPGSRPSSKGGTRRYDWVLLPPSRPRASAPPPSRRSAKGLAGRNQASQPTSQGSAKERAVAASMVARDPAPPPLATRCWTHQDRSVALHKSRYAHLDPSGDCHEKSRRRSSPALIVRSQLSAMVVQCGSRRACFSAYRNPASLYLALTLLRESAFSLAPNACQSVKSSASAFTSGRRLVRPADT